MKKYIIAMMLVPMCLIACHKDAKIESKTPVITEQTAEPWATEANFTWAVDFPGEISSVVKIGLKADMSDAVSYGDDTHTSQKEFRAKATGLTGTTTYYYCYEVWNPGMSFLSEVYSFTTLYEGMATVTTAAITNISNFSAKCGGNVVYDGGHTVTERGVCWSTDHNPSISGSHTSSGSGTGSFTCSITNLEPETQYYVRAYAINSVGTSYGSEVSLTTSPLANYTISVSSNPSDGGEASGGGTYQQCQSCTVSATANNGYTFANWTEDGSQVSTNSSYTFTVNSNRTLVANFKAVPPGAINGLFSVSSSKQVWFSQGNLQYQASTQTWRFAEQQYDAVGDDSNSSISSNYSGWIDLFGWGTSGYNNKYPYMTSTTTTDYGYESNDIAGTHYDWGVHNAISNGGNQAEMWRTLTRAEWVYVFNTRSTDSGIRYAKACVNNMNGVILLPDDWSSNYYKLNNSNNGGASFSSNTITASQWTTLEQHGAVFLPAAGERYGTGAANMGSRGYYWSASYCDSESAYYVEFYDLYLQPQDHYYRCYRGISVRLVCSAQ